MEITSNFEFLKEHDPLFFQLASGAENAFARDPNTTLIKLRQLAEVMAKQIATYCAIEFDEQNYFTFADKIEQQVKSAQERVNNLTPAILAKAFKGELTADWRTKHPELISGENSAEALLKRIQAEQETLTKPTKTKKVKK